MIASRLLHRSTMVLRHTNAAVGATAGLLAAIGIARPIGAQVDSVVPELQLSFAAGPALDVGSATDARVGYTVQGAVTFVRPHSPWRLRTDLVYLHAEALHLGMHSGRAGTDGSNGSNGANGANGSNGEAVSSAAGFVSAVATPRTRRGPLPYVIGGIGLGAVTAMRGTTYMEQSPGSIGFAWQGGGGVEWARGRRAIRLETRLQSIRTAGVTGWYTTLPVTIGVRF